MRVEHAPYVFFLDRTLCELAIVCGGIRIAMSREEATAFWIQIGTALKSLYADGHPSADVLMRRLAEAMPTVAKASPWAVDPGLENIIDYAQRPVVSSPADLQQNRSSSPP